MRIRDILKDNQPQIYKDLNSKKNKKNKQKLTEKDIKMLMSNSSYRRGPGGSIRQVGFGGK